MINSLLPIDGTISIYRDCTLAIRDKNPPREVVVAVAKCILTNAKLTCEAFLEGKLSNLDPIVGENACQIRALVAITFYMEEDLKEHLRALKDKVEKLLEKLKLQVNPLNGNLDIQLENLGLTLNVTDKVDYMLRSHLLTIGKYFDMEPNGREKSGIDCSKINEKLQTEVSKKVLQSIIKIAQMKISEDSVRFIQMEADKLTDKFIVSQLTGKMFNPVKGKTLHASSAFYNLKTVLLRAEEMKVPVLVKEFKSDNPRSIYFCTSNNELEDNQPILVVECFLSESCTEQVIASQGLRKLILANVACTPDYSKDESIILLEEHARNEILEHKSFGESLGCHTSSPTVFKVVHIHAATVKEEKVI